MVFVEILYIFSDLIIDEDLGCLNYDPWTLDSV